MHLQVASLVAEIFVLSSKIILLPRLCKAFESYLPADFFLASVFPKMWHIYSAIGTMDED